MRGSCGRRWVRVSVICWTRDKTLYVHIVLLYGLGLCHQTVERQMGDSSNTKMSGLNYCVCQTRAMNFRIDQSIVQMTFLQLAHGTKKESIQHDSLQRKWRIHA